MNPSVDWYFTKANRWQEAINLLRIMVLDCGLTEALKWGCPCYTMNNSNIVLIHVFKDYCALLLFKGVLLKDPKNILIQQTENVQTARQIRFTKIEEISKLERVLKSYIKEAIEVEQSGIKVTLKKPTEFKMADEFQQKLDEMPDLKTAFKALTPGRQRAYLLHFSQPKQSKTRESRVEKCIPFIMDGKGLNNDMVSKEKQ